MQNLAPPHKRIPPLKVLLNIGACMDIPTGYPVKGKYGETIINGGLGMATGIQGPGNTFKSRLLHYMALTAVSRIRYSGLGSTYQTYDTEQNTHEYALDALYKRYENLNSPDALESGIWSITDKTLYYGDTYYAELKKWLKEVKMKTKGVIVQTPFLGRDGKTLLEFPFPTVSSIDSLTAFKTSEIGAVEDKHDIGASERNTLDMRQGKAKAQLLDDLTVTAESTGHFVLMTAHLREEIIIPQGPMTPKPKKQLQHMQAGVKTKGTTSNYSYLINNGWDIQKSSLCLDDDKMPKYPTDKLSKKMDTDLNEIQIKQIRGKAGMSGVSLNIIVTQSSGVMPELTEYNYLTESKMFGIGGSNRGWYLEIYPDVKFTRKTVRDLIDSDPVFRRALNLTSEICQIYEHWRWFEPVRMCTMKQLHDDMKEIGYDWKVLLATRGWYTFFNDKPELPKFMSCVDFLNARIGDYIPYWMSAEEKAKLKKKGEFKPSIHPDYEDELG